MLLNLPNVTHAEEIGTSFSSQRPADNFSETQSAADLDCEQERAAWVGAATDAAGRSFVNPAAPV